jgi:hypothetical protein
LIPDLTLCFSPGVRRSNGADATGNLHARYTQAVHVLQHSANNSARPLPLPDLFIF